MKDVSVTENTILMNEKEWSENNNHFKPDKLMNVEILMTADQWATYNMQNEYWEYPLEKFHEDQERKKREVLKPSPIYAMRTIDDFATELKITYEGIQQAESIKALFIERKKKLEQEIINSTSEDWVRYLQYELGEEGYKNIHPEFDVHPMNDRFFKITLNSLLPVYVKKQNTLSSVYARLQSIYMGGLMSKLKEQESNIPSFSKNEKVYVKIIQFHKNHNISDLDNRFHSFIFNALRYAGIIVDDSFTQLCYMDEGRFKKGQEYTEIFVGHYEDMSEIDSF